MEAIVFGQQHRPLDVRETIQCLSLGWNTKLRKVKSGGSGPITSIRAEPWVTTVSVHASNIDFQNSSSLIPAIGARLRGKRLSQIHLCKANARCTYKGCTGKPSTIVSSVPSASKEKSKKLSTQTALRTSLHHQHSRNPTSRNQQHLQLVRKKSSGTR